MNYILVLQWSATTESDYDALIAMESLLEEKLPEAHGFVDGHDFGAGEMNIFVHTDSPLEAFQDAATSLGADRRWEGVRAAYRRVDGDRHVVIWPKTLKAFRVS